MARLAIELTTGDSHSYDITPAAEYAFEQEFNTGIYKRIENKSQRSVCFANNEGHSIKPEVFQDSLEALFGDQKINKCELFGRRKRNGWDVVGNECPGSIGIDIEQSIMELIAK